MRKTAWVLIRWKWPEIFEPIFVFLKRDAAVKKADELVYQINANPKLNAKWYDKDGEINVENGSFGYSLEEVELQE